MGVPVVVFGFRWTQRPSPTQRCHPKLCNSTIPRAITLQVMGVSGAVAKWSGRCPDADREGGPQPRAPISQAPVKALATITASGFGHPKANTLPWPLRGACIASIPCSALYADTGFLNPPPLGPRIGLSRP